MAPLNLNLLQYLYSPFMVQGKLIFIHRNYLQL